MDEGSKLAIMRQLPSGLSFSVLGKKNLNCNNGNL